MKLTTFTLAASTLLVGLGITCQASAQQNELKETLTQFAAEQSQQVATDIAKQINQNLRSALAIYAKQTLNEQQPETVAKNAELENKQLTTTSEDE